MRRLEVSADTVQLQHTGRLSLVTLNRPQKLNAFNAQMTGMLLTRLQEADLRTDTGAIVLSGAGGAFSAGGDISSMTGPESPRVNHPDWNLVFGILAVEKPLIAMVDGPAIGLGLSVALLCDCVIVSNDAKLGDTHVSLGLVAGDGAAITMPLILGPHRAKELLMSGRIISGEEAAAMGLVHRAVPRHELSDETHRIASQLASQPAYAVRATKLLVNRQIRSMAHDLLDVALAWERLSMQLPDHTAAVKEWRTRRGTYTDRDNPPEDER